VLWTRETKDDRGKTIVAATRRSLMAPRDEFDRARQELAGWVFTRARKRGAIGWTARAIATWFPLILLITGRPLWRAIDANTWWLAGALIILVAGSVWTAVLALRWLADRSVSADEICASLVAEGFCGECGTGVLYINEEMLPGIVDVQSCTADDPAVIPAQVQFQLAERIPWMKDAHLLPGFDRYPPQTE
jgi:hypothetical protein